ncbi:MAG: aspartate--tRNA(Asn) ligase [Candidatus Pacearchaeota archaeon]|nr:aspartate--tRNA(Asn) ligase [Candidatus Pacearchaeota archaeon]
MTKESERTYIQEIKKGPVFIEGWIHEIRDLAKIKFILLRDMTGVVQCILKDEKLMKKFSDLSVESVISIKGEAKPAQVKSPEVSQKEIEVEIKDFEIISKAEKLPINIHDKDIETGFAKRLDYRFLDFHTKRTQAIFRIQTEIANSFREFFYNKGYMEIQPPCIISAASEGGTELFPVQYFEKKAYLAQSPQLYKQMLACSIEKTFTITPIWRAEKHNTTRHINEIRQMDIEVAFMNQEQIMKEQELVVQYIVKKVLEKCSEELKILNVKLKVPKAVYLHYEDAIKKAGGKVGEDFTPEQEKVLGDMYPDSIIFTHSWPTSIKPFYIMPKNENPDEKESCGFDSLYGGIEISSGGQRIHLPELLTKRIKAKKLDPKNFKGYIDSFRYGAPNHSGWSIGLERLTQVICGLNNVKEATMFPRDRDRLTP